MTDLWTPTPDRERINFSECEVLIEQMTSNKGTSYHKITFNLLPIANGNLITEAYFKFANHSKPWDSHVLPAIRDLVSAGKITSAPDINGKYVSWCFRQWQSYRKNDIKYWRERAESEKEFGEHDEATKSLAKIQVDGKGNEFVEKRYMHLLDVFDSQEAAQAANDEFYGVESGNDSIPGFDDTTSGSVEPPTNFGDKQTALAFLPNFVKMSMSNGKVNRDKLQNFIDSNEVLKAHFSMESEEVQNAIQQAELLEQDELPF